LKVSLVGVSLVALALAVTSTAPAPRAAVGADLSAALATQQTMRATPAGHGNRLFRPATMAEFRSRVRVAKTHSPIFRGGPRSKPRATTSPTRTSIGGASAPHVVLYAGLNKDGIKAADNGSQLTPPDSTGSIGPSHYVEMANSVIHVWNRSLASVSAATLATFLGAPAGTPLCDPQIQWDPTSARWLYTVLYCNVATSDQFLLFGWSKTSNPANLTTGWCHFLLDSTPDLIDFPKLGHNNGWLIIGGNAYDETTPSSNPPFLSAAMLWFQLPGSTVSTCPSVFPTFDTNSFPQHNEAGVNTFTPVPVNNASGSSDGYVLSAYDPSGAAGNPVAPQSKIAVWHVTAAGALIQDASVSVSSYDTPPAAREPGGTLDTLVGQLTQAVGAPIQGIWTQHTVSGGAGTKVTWYHLKIGSGTDLTKVEEGDITHATQDVYNAAISPNYVNTGAAIFYNRSDTSNNPLIAAQTRTNATALGTMAPGELVLVTSPAADADFSCSSPFGPPCRWGDYAGASPDPVSLYAVWGTGVYNTANTSTPAWRNRNFAVPTAPAGAPTSVAPWYGGTDFECLTWTAPASNGGTAVLNYTINAYAGVTLAKSVNTSTPTARGCMSGLTAGVSYTFTVAANNGAGPGPESTPTSPVLISRNSSQSTSAASSSRSGAQQASPAPSPPSR